MAGAQLQRHLHLHFFRAMAGRMLSGGRHNTKHVASSMRSDDCDVATMTSHGDEYGEDDGDGDGEYGGDGDEDGFMDGLTGGMDVCEWLDG